MNLTLGTQIWQFMPSSRVASGGTDSIGSKMDLVLGLYAANSNTLSYICF